MKVRKYVLAIVLGIILSMGLNVYACGEINELKSDIGTVTIIDSSNYLVTIPEGTREVTLTGSTNYKWVDGYMPRRVPTDSTAELKVDGNACGYGIYTYFVKFKELSNTIAENDTPVTPTPAPENPTTPVTPTDPASQEGVTPPANGGTVVGSSNLILSELKIEGYDDLGFDPYKYSYTLEVDYDVTNLKLTAKPADENVAISISDNVYDLKEGENIVVVTLIDPNGNRNVYNITVNRVKTKSDNNFLASITVAGYQLNFDPSITFYKLGIGKERVLNIQAETESELASYVILGNTNLSDGSEITIRVTAEDGSTKDYVLAIERVFNIMDYWIYIVITLLVLLLVLLLVIMRNKKNKKKLGPEALEGQKNTAGVIQEIAPQNSSPVQTVDTNSSQQTVNLGTGGTLKIIKPTNLESPVETVVAQSTEDNSSTEVFKL